MLELMYTAHSRERIRKYNLLEEEVYGFYINGTKCVVSAIAHSRKHTQNLHLKGMLLYRYKDWIMVINPSNKNKPILVTLYPAMNPEMYHQKI